MSELLLENLRVLEAVITLPRIGAWSASLVVDSDQDLTGPVTLRSDDGAFSLVGTVLRGGVNQNRLELRVVGGAGGLGQTLAPRYYRDRPLPLRLPLGDLLREAGETLSPTADAALLATDLKAWTRERMTAVRALRALLESSGASWRVLPDGTVWVGVESWPDAQDFDHQVMRDDPAAGRLELATETVAAELVPGTTFDGRKVSAVVHEVRPSSTRSTVTFESGTSGTDRLKAAFEAAVKRVVPSLDFLALYSGTVRVQDADGTLQCQMDDARFPGITGVPLRTFVPGATVKVAAGARVLVGFEQGDPARPFGQLWESGTLNELRIDAATKQTFEAPEILVGAGATRGIARLNDTVDRSAAMGTWMASVDTSIAAIVTAFGITPVITVIPSTAPAAGAIAAISSASTKGKCA